MPKEYIARLVYDRNHYSMAIVKRGWEVVGGVTYRPFEARRFAEIVFFAITGTEQVKVRSWVPFQLRMPGEALSFRLGSLGIRPVPHEPPQGARQILDPVHAFLDVRR